MAPDDPFFEGSLEKITARREELESELTEEQAKQFNVLADEWAKKQNEKLRSRGSPSARASPKGP